MNMLYLLGKPLERLLRIQGPRLEPAGLDGTIKARCKVTCLREPGSKVLPEFDTATKHQVAPSICLRLRVCDRRLKQRFMPWYM